MNLKKLLGIACGETSNSKYKDLALLLVRLSVAASFMAHGWAKISNPDAFLGFFASLGFGTALFYLVAYIEFLGGIALLLGVFVRLAASLLAIIMVVAITTVHLQNGFIAQGGYEFQLLLLMTSIGFALVGPGRFSVHHKYCKH